MENKEENKQGDLVPDATLGNTAFGNTAFGNTAFGETTFGDTAPAESQLTDVEKDMLALCHKHGIIPALYAIELTVFASSCISQGSAYYYKSAQEHITESIKALKQANKPLIIKP